MNFSVFNQIEDELNYEHFDFIFVIQLYKLNIPHLLVTHFLMISLNFIRFVTTHYHLSSCLQIISKSQVSNQHVFLYLPVFNALSSSRLLNCFRGLNLTSNDILTPA